MDSNSSSPFPDILASRAEKETPEYGLKYAKAIWGVHILGVTTYDEQRARDLINRQYAEGLQSVEKMKSWRGTTNTSYANLDYTPINIIATTVDNIVGKLMNTPYKVQCNAIDPESKSKFDDYRKNLFAQMFLKPLSDDVEKKTGLPLVPKNRTLPETDEEAELHLKMNYKDDASIAMEEAFDYVFSSNNFDAEKELVLRDYIVVKRGAYLRYYDENFKIKVERADPVDVITTYSKYADHRGDPYRALIKAYTVGDLAVISDFDDKILYEIARSQQGVNNNPKWTFGTSYEGYYSSGVVTGKPWYNFNIQVLDFYFIGIDKKTKEFKERKGRKYINDTEETSTDEKDTEVISRNVKNLYQGRWVINTNHIFSYKREVNTPREKNGDSYSTEVTIPLKIYAPGIYDMKNKSHVERMIPHEDNINLANLARQLLMIKMKPPGVAIDIQGVMDACKGMGIEGKPLELIKIYEQTGNYVFSSATEDGQTINSKVITELRGGLAGTMQELIAIHQFERNLINEVIGYNTAVDASSPDANALVGVQNNAIQATNNSLRPIFNSFLRLTEDLSKDVALMIQDSIEQDSEAFMQAIGTQATKTLAYGKALAFVQMGIKIELLPDTEEKAQINQLIQLGIQNQMLTPSDVIRIRQVLKENDKLAAQLLVYLEEKNRKNKMQEAQANIQNTSQAQQQSAQVASQMKQQELQLEAQTKTQLLRAEFELKGKLSAQEHQQIMEQIAGKNVGIENQANINAGKAVKVQAISTDGKLEEAKVAADNKIEVKHIEHQSKLLHTAFENATKKEPAAK